ncbi:MAG: hypothetical protein NZL83_04630 [Candidatus Absconditabacterales bacterium]|nr:hypothetical protein [Candidatus Absconditabacterales bacterium]
MFTLTSFTHNTNTYNLRFLTHHYAASLATLVRDNFFHLSQSLPGLKPDFCTEDEIDCITIKLKEFALG